MLLIPFYTIIIDFIITLLIIFTGINYLLTIIYKFLKKVLLLLGLNI